MTSNCGHSWCQRVLKHMEVRADKTGGKLCPNTSSGTGQIMLTYGGEHVMCIQHKAGTPQLMFAFNGKRGGALQIPTAGMRQSVKAAAGGTVLCENSTTPDEAMKAIDRALRAFLESEHAPRPKQHPRVLLLLAAVIALLVGLSLLL